MPSIDPDEQRRQLDQLLERLEQYARWWPRFRWAQLIFSVALVASSAYQFAMLQQVSDQTSLAAMGIEQSRASELIDKVVDFRMRTIRWQLEKYFWAMLSGIGGLILLLSTLVSWRGKIMEAALLVCLRNIGLPNGANDDAT